MKSYILILLALILVTGCNGNSKDTKIERITLTRATEDCSVQLTVNIPVSLLKEAIIKEKEWKCTEGVKDTLYHTIYHIYHPLLHVGWYVVENPLERIKEEK